MKNAMVTIDYNFSDWKTPRNAATLQAPSLYLPRGKNMRSNPGWAEDKKGDQSRALMVTVTNKV
jgi:hypothetical protein